MKMQHGSFSRFFLFAFLASFLALTLPCPASAQDYPSRAITVYCGYEAGATTDLTARGLAAGLEKLLGVAVVVENKAGGEPRWRPAWWPARSPTGIPWGSSPRES